MILPERLYHWRIDPYTIIRQAEQSLQADAISITTVRAKASEGGPGDYYSNGDYWWPNTRTQNGLPYVRRDGKSNPKAFKAHREMLRRMRTHVANLAAGYAVTGNRVYAEKAAGLLRVFFIDPATRMNPHLRYAQAIPGVCSGRGIGIIDTLHLIDVPQAIEMIRLADVLSGKEMKALRLWFVCYLRWMVKHRYGIQERAEKNNHRICWYVQAAVFARFTGNNRILQECREGFRTILLPEHMAKDGSFPRELARTKPYGYSIFTLDNMVTLCQVLSIPKDDLWRYELPDGRGIRRALHYMYPYLANKSKWPKKRDVEHWKGWPVRMSFMLFAGLALKDMRYMELWSSLKADPSNPEIRRNMAIRQPLLFIAKE
ncbi:alginate lyase family protein [Paenibacillus spongiae]|uniref:Alginate lyase family protein n=1 Tax=Paenibacillus spongiae TaxID=2909671 RepID=A0ABY5S3Z9_9BACL|nr:alginate lyase family protein [Paenibacillus spongiae]UVI28629.1 alginate lyase family protein [Paenibacillus spongiae]